MFLQLTYREMSSLYGCFASASAFWFQRQGQGGSSIEQSFSTMRGRTDINVPANENGMALTVNVYSLNRATDVLVNCWR